MLSKQNIAIALLAIFMASCSVVKSPQSANFQKVKYNAHLKKASFKNDKKLATTVNSFDELAEMEKADKKELATTKQVANKSPLLASLPLIAAEKEITKIKTPAVDDQNNSKIDRKTNIFNQATVFHPIKKANEAITNLNAAAAAADDDGIGGLLYLLLVIILVLIILSLLGDLGGGIIGTLIAILLILLILRLLGVI